MNYGILRIVKDTPVVFSKIREKEDLVSWMYLEEPLKWDRPAMMHSV